MQFVICDRHNAYLLTPVKQSTLAETFARILGGSRAGHPPSARTAHKPLDGCGGLRILLAEDNIVNQKLAMRLIEKRGHTVVLANDGVEALEKAQNQSFDLVLMDIQMPKMDGFEVTRAIRCREDGREEHLPIVAMTAHALKGDKERCLAAGMDGYIAKPIQVRHLDQALDRAAHGVTRSAKHVGVPLAAEADNRATDANVQEVQAFGTGEGKWQRIQDRESWLRGTRFEPSARFRV